MAVGSARKRARDASMEDTMAEEELHARGPDRDALDPPESSISAINSFGPPWFDDVTGEVLPPKLVEAGMAVERERFKEFDVKEDVDEGEAVGHDVVNSRWVLRKRLKKHVEEVKARIVGQQFRRRGDLIPGGVFAGTPTTLGMMLVFYYAAALAMNLDIGDVVTAFLQARLPDDVVMFVQPPGSERKPGKLWRLKRALYGLRASPRYFQTFFASALIGLGWKRGVVDPQFFWLPGGLGYLSVHADDVLIATLPEQTERIKQAIAEVMKIRWEDQVDDQHWSKYLGRWWQKSGSGYVVKLGSNYYKGLLETLGLVCLLYTSPSPRD